MWTKTIKTKHNNQLIDVQVWLDGVNEHDKPLVKIQTMVNEYFLLEEIVFENRDSAYDFIFHYPVSMAKAFVVREGYNVGAFN